MAKVLTRNLTAKITRLYEVAVPAFLRNNYAFACLVFKPVLGKYTRDYFTFKERAKTMSQLDFENEYKKLRGSFVKRATDLNSLSVTKILEDVVGENVLDAGCGTGYLLKQINTRYPNLKLTGTDILAEPVEAEIRILSANVEQLPFQDKTFDTVITSHTLEHVLDLEVALKELRRVTKKRLIIVVPRQRASKYTPDLHLRFFPNEDTLLKNFHGNNFSFRLLDNDWYYVEDFA